MVYLSGFRFPDRAQEANYMAFSPRARQTCYDSYYPFGLFEGRTLPELDFLEITILYGGNGSGKTTLLNVMADALRQELRLTSSLPRQFLEVRKWFWKPESIQVS